MVKKLLFLFFILSIIKIIAQDDRKPFYGKIYDDLGTLANAHIINLSTKKATFSKDNGEFKLFVKTNDSLKVTSIGYKTTFLVIKPTLLGMNETKIVLKKDIYELDEVEIKKHYLTGSIYSDSKQVKHKRLINASSLKLPNANKRKFTLAERRLYTARGGGNILSVDFLLNSINGRIKKMKKLKDIENNEKEINYLQNNFESYILNDLQIDSLNVNAFIYYLQENKEFIQNKKNDFHIIEFMKAKAIEFKKLNTSSKK